MIRLYLTVRWKNHPIIQSNAKSKVSLYIEKKNTKWMWRFPSHLFKHCARNAFWGSQDLARKFRLIPLISTEKPRSSTRPAVFSDPCEIIQLNQGGIMYTLHIKKIESIDSIPVVRLNFYGLYVKCMLHFVGTKQKTCPTPNKPCIWYNTTKLQVCLTNNSRKHNSRMVVPSNPLFWTPISGGGSFEGRVV